MVACRVADGGVPGGTLVERLRGVSLVAGGTFARHAASRVLWVPAVAGGCAVFVDDEWHAPATDLMRDLFAWAQQTAVRLRVVGHRGPADVVEGPDGRLQPVGETIATALQLVNRGSEAGIVVSSSFRSAFRGVAGVEFHDQRLACVGSGELLPLWLMSAGSRSQWSDVVSVDHRQLLWDAVERCSGWEAVYHAKRLLQVNSHDREVTSALAGLESVNFHTWTGTPQQRLNPILGHLDPGELRHLIEHGQLIELGCNEVLCRRGDAGNTMFVILRGRVGIDDAVSGTARQTILGEGEIVGELAFALNCPRTADVVSLGESALLSLDYDHVCRLLGDRRPAIDGLVRQFVNGRALEHVCQSVPFLIGTPLATLPEDSRRRWKGYLDLLRPGSHIIEMPLHRPFRLAGIRDADPRTGAGGIYILASGRLRSRTADAKCLDSEHFPLLSVDLPDTLVAPDHEYVVDEGPARIVFISQEAIDSLPLDVHQELVQGLERALASLYHYDAFISYNFADEPAAERWQRGLEAAGLRVFRDSSAQPGVHYPSKDGDGLLDSLTMLVLTSLNPMGKDAEDNWLLKEVRFREEHFDEQRGIVPIRLSGGDPRSLGIMYASVQAEGREADAIRDVVEIIDAIRRGEQKPPCARFRHAGGLS